jgi:hypothetical protein
MVIKPMAMLFGKNAAELDRMFKELGIKMLIPLFVPKCLKQKRKCREDLRKNALS